jgi:hypothetical protein
MFVPGWVLGVVGTLIVELILLIVYAAIRKK